MSRPVLERLRELETDVRGLPVLPAAAVRARGRRRGRRQLITGAVAGAVVVAAAGVTAAGTVERSRHDSAPAAGTPALTCVLSLPDDPATVSIRVFSGAAPAGTSGAIASQLRARQFQVLAGADGGDPDPADAAVLRYGPAEIGAASLVRAFVHGPVGMRFDPGRRDPSVDLVLGPAFTRLAGAIEVNRALAEAGEPSAPPQC